MWYVIQVRTGKEEQVRDHCRKLIMRYEDSALTDVRIYYYDRQMKRQGEWRTEKRVMFPGYVFLESGDPKTLFQQLKRVIGMTKLLGADNEAVPLTAKEAEFLEKLGGGTESVDYSEGIIVGDRVQVYSGPLQGLEGLICKIDRHKRLAWIELEFLGQKRRMELGLGVVRRE
ncbi:MAG: antiterminator LoaP [Lachnospiraceae bacterium]|nr:antiterminator LoaP [Lachnospiraceae bacterium]